MRIHTTTRIFFQRNPSLLHPMHRTNPEFSPHKLAILTAMTTAIVANPTTKAAAENPTTTANPTVTIMANPAILATPTTTTITIPRDNLAIQRNSVSSMVQQATQPKLAKLNFETNATWNSSNPHNSLNNNLSNIPLLLRILQVIITPTALVTLASFKHPLFPIHGSTTQPVPKTCQAITNISKIMKNSTSLSLFTALVTLFFTLMVKEKSLLNPQLIIVPTPFVKYGMYPDYKNP